MSASGRLRALGRRQGKQLWNSRPRLVYRSPGGLVVMEFQANDETTTNLGKTSYMVGNRGSNYPQRFQIP